MKQDREKLRYVVVAAALFLLVMVATRRIGLAGRVLAEGDVFTYFYPYWAEATRAIRSARVPLWNSYLFMGVPFAANSQVGFFYPLNWPLWLFLPPQRSVHVTIVLHLCLAAASAVVWGRRTLRLGHTATFTLAAVFSLGGYLGAQMEHVNQLQGLAWLPLMLMLARETAVVSGDEGSSARRPAGEGSGRGAWVKTLRPACGLAVVVGLVLLAGHTQTAFISVIGAGLYGLWPALTGAYRKGHWRGLFRGGAFLAGAVALGSLLAAVQILPTLQLSRLSVRAQGLPLNERVSFSLSPLYLPRALLPPFGGVLALDHLEHVAYVGITGIALALTACVRFRDEGGRHRPVDYQGLCAIVLLALFFSLGRYNPLYLLLARYVPGFAHFRVPARWLALYAIGMAGLVGHAVQAGVEGLSLDVRQARLVWLALALLVIGAVGGPLLAGEVGVGLLTLGAWAGLAVAALGLAMATSWRPGVATVALIALLLVELLVGGESLPKAQATASQAFTSLRPAVAHLLAAKRGQEGPGDRFLSMSDTTFDPGDLSLIRAIYGPQLTEEQLYRHVVATKKKEILSPNLPLAFGVPAVDGYDGGVLPLERFVTLQEAYLPAEDVSIDGRLRENITRIPESRWLNLFNVRYVITDKLSDAWIDDVFYDLQFGARLSQGERAEVAHLPHFEATALGVVSSLQDGDEAEEGEVVGLVRVGLDDARVESFPVRVGQQVPTLDVGRAPEAATRLRWSRPASVISVTFEAILDAGEWNLRGVSLIDERTGSFHSLLLSDTGCFRKVHSGDVKIYENLDVLPRAFLVHHAELATDDAAALDLMRDPAFDPTSKAVIAGCEQACRAAIDGTEGTGPASFGDGESPGQAKLVTYEPERLVVETVSERRSYLIVTDAHYPGWEATVDGERVPICRADVLFRAVPVPPGKHRVNLIFQPTIYRIGGIISLGGLVAWLGLLFFAQRIAERVGRCYNVMRG